MKNQNLRLVIRVKRIHKDLSFQVQNLKTPNLRKRKFNFNKTFPKKIEKDGKF